MKQVVGDTLIPFGLSPSEYGVLDHISANPGVSNAELARYLLITPQALGRLTRKITDAGYVTSSSSHHKRRQPLTVTPAGQALHTLARPSIEDALQRLFAGLSRGEQQQLGALLQNVADVGDTRDTNLSRLSPI
jgi:DNA-binding MarR family transcriptional regulator